MEVRETGKERAVVFNKAVFSLWAFMYFLWFRLILDLCVCECVSCMFVGVGACLVLCLCMCVWVACLFKEFHALHVC